MESLPHQLERTLVIQASPDTVFRYFTDSDRWAAWWGAGSSIESRPGGAVVIRYPNGVRVLGEVLEIHEPERIVFTYGYESGKPIPPGASRVTVRLDPDARGTRLQLKHEFAEAAVRDQHVAGWRFQLSLFANLVADHVNANAGDLVDAWYEAWTMADDSARAQALSRIVAPNASFRDRYACIQGLPELSDHIAASLRFMPGFHLERNGAIRHCQHTVLSNWIARGPDGQPRMSGSSVFLLGADGRIESVTGLMNPPEAA
jgi:uncharacterized protein YndB with AHSA1/START domain